MFVVVVEFSLRDGCAQAFRERVVRQARDSLEFEPECRLFDVCIDPGEENYVLLYEVYSDRAAFDAHLSSAHFKAFDSEVRDCISDKRVSVYERL